MWPLSEVGRTIYEVSEKILENRLEQMAQARRGVNGVGVGQLKRDANNLLSMSGETSTVYNSTTSMFATTSNFLDKRKLSRVLVPEGR